MNLRAKLLELSVPISYVIGKIRMPFSRKQITGRHYLNLKTRLKPGMVIVSTTHGELSNLFIPGDWNHAALVRDSESVIEAVGSGVRVSDMVSFFTTKDHLAVLDPTFLDGVEKGRAVRTAESFIGRPYDTRFVSGNKGLYCSELIYEAFRSVKSDTPFVPKERMGLETILPQDIYNAKEKFREVWSSRDDRSMKLGDYLVSRGLVI